MADSSIGLHEARQDIAPATMDRHRGIVSLVEELEAMDWHDQRVDATGDREPKEVLAHNRDEETEHAADSVDRGAPGPDRDPVVDAARRAALAEDRLIFNGHGPAGVRGVVETSTNDPITINEDHDRQPNHVARAVETLRRAGVAGPYAIALGPRCHAGVIESTQHGGYPVLEHLRLIAEGPVLWAPAVEGAVARSRRGGDFEPQVGQDLSIGNLPHDAGTVTLYLVESLTCRAAGPEAAIALRHADERPRRRGRARGLTA